MLGLANSLTGGATIGFSPADIADCKFWFTVEAGIESGGAGEVITSWESQVGTLFAGNTTANQRPTFNTTHVTFDGGDSLDFFSDVDLTSVAEITLDTSDGGWTVMAIYTDGDWDAAAAALFGVTGNTQNFLRHNADASGTDRYRIKVANEQEQIALDSGLTDDRYYSIMVTCSADAELLLYVDNTAQADNSQSLSANTKDFTIGGLAQKAGSDLLSGHAKHFIAYDRILTSGERSQLQAWANGFIG
jgi:hypothetical protein